MSVRPVCLAITLGVLVWSGVAPVDRFTWWLEVAPVLIGLPIAVATHARFPLSSLVAVLLTAHAVILCVGGHWTYEQVPLGLWIEPVFGWRSSAPAPPS